MTSSDRSETGVVRTIGETFGDVIRLSNENPEFDADDWIFRFWPLTVPLCLIGVLLTFPIYVLGRVIRTVSGDRHGALLEFPMDFFAVMTIVIVAGNAVASFNEVSHTDD